MNDIEYLKKYYKGNMEDAIKRLNNGEPLQYIVGDVNFYGNTIKVDKRVLIPRFETEGLCEIAKEYLKDNIDCIDLGTGSGCIAITLKKMNKSINMDAIDISSDALTLARDNAKINNVEINFIQNDMLNNIDKKYDLIISNPPYIRYDEEVMDIVKNNEPSLALYADNDGLYFYEEILKNCKKYLNDRFLIAFEIGYTQGDRVRDFALKYLGDVSVSVEKDLSNRDRFVFIIK